MHLEGSRQVYQEFESELHHWSPPDTFFAIVQLILHFFQKTLNNDAATQPWQALTCCSKNGHWASLSTFVHHHGKNGDKGSLQ